MKNPTLLISFGLALIVLAGSALAFSSYSHAETQDPFEWLEDVWGSKSLDWVKSKNEKTLKLLESDPRYKTVESETTKMVMAKDRVPSPDLRHGWVYNFWKDEKNIKGIWRRTPLAQYKTETPEWETILDIDELSKKEGKSWVWHGDTCLPPEKTRCLVQLSNGGKDAVEVREFDTVKKEFIADGFLLPEAKSQVSWKDINTIWVGTDFGPGSLTTSGYPRLVKLWKRGTPLAQAELIYEGKESDVSAFGFTSFNSEGHTHYVGHSPSFFEQELSIWNPENKTLTKIPFPLDASYHGTHQGKIFVSLRGKWKAPQFSAPAGSLVALNASHPQISTAETVLVPTATQSIQGPFFTKNGVFALILDNVNGKILSLHRDSTGLWSNRALPFPEHGTLGVVSSDLTETDFITMYTDFLTPPTLFLSNDNPTTMIVQKPQVLKVSPHRFDGSDFSVHQYFAQSVDGTQIPYYIVHHKTLKTDGTHPTLLYGYGGFEVPLTPTYLRNAGKLWLEKGGIYVLANIRGGGEFGPMWHQAALKENRQKAFDDFAAVAKDLIHRQITSPKHLGIMGGSNGGLLVGTTFTQHPELFNAVICQVPLLDMIKYHTLLAGASWQAEYGSPDDPAMRKVLLKYSPYHNLKTKKTYPKVFFTTSTADDRVHPAHARKMAARMESFGHPLMYFENIEGGHGGGADLKHEIHETSLHYIYLYQQLMEKQQ